MYFWIGIAFSIVGFILWIWYEAKHAPDADDDRNPIFKNERTLFNEEHDEAAKFRELPKC